MTGAPEEHRAPVRHALARHAEALARWRESTALLRRQLAEAHRSADRYDTARARIARQHPPTTKGAHVSTCRYAGPVSGPCTRPATHLVDGQPYCTRDATAAARPGARVERIAPDPPATAPAAPPARMTSAGRAMTALTGLDSPDRQRGTCHTCGLPVDRRGECRECQ